MNIPIQKVMTYFKFCYFFVSILSNLAMEAQSFPQMPIEFVAQGKTLKNALAGGLNAPQLSAVDLNNDGLDDLYIFDRAGNIHLTFINQGTANAPDYRYAPELAFGFPDIKNWVLLRDYNGDGVMDMFAYSATPGIDGISVFTGRYENNQLAFTPFRINRFNLPDVLRFALTSGNQTQIFVTRIDYPAIEDIDGDGDLDILTFNVAGGFLEYFQNQSVERGFGLDSLIFRFAAPCWGGFFESGITPEVDLANRIGDCTSNLENTVESRHAGSTVTALNLNESCGKDLLIGDLSFDNLVALYNNGTCNTAWITQQDINFPSYDVPAKVAPFPNSFYIDLDGDGVRDLAVAPNERENTENVNTIWYYRNIQRDDLPKFQFQQTNFLGETMLDFGSGSNPTFVDYNGDGLMDIVVGNHGIFKSFGVRDARLFLFENIGTSTAPKYQLVNDDYLGFSRFNEFTWDFAPHFADLDGDGDLDLIVGEIFGGLLYGENIGGVNKKIEIVNITPNWMNINIGQSSVPFVADIDKDGLPDLLIGERNGNVNFFKNTGTASNAMFNNTETVLPNTQLFGRIDAREPGFVTGFSAPFVLEINSEQTVLTGTDQGQIEYYKVDPQNISSKFEELDLNFGNIKAGARTRIALADINNNGLLEALVGNLRGGLHLYATNLPSSSSISSINRMVDHTTIQVFPSIANGSFQYEIDRQQQRWLKGIKVYSAVGQEIRFEQNNNTIIFPSNQSNGIYYISFLFEQYGVVSKKVLLQR
jgi:hypothetical protein